MVFRAKVARIRERGSGLCPDVAGWCLSPGRRGEGSELGPTEAAPPAGPRPREEGAHTDQHRGLGRAGVSGTPEQRAQEAQGPRRPTEPARRYPDRH